MLLRKVLSACSTSGALLGIFLLLLPVTCPSRDAYADDRERRLIWAGLDLFPSLLAADMRIAEKTGPDGTLLLVLAYVDDRESAAEMAEYLKKIKQIRKIPIRIELRKSTSFTHRAQPLPAGIFLTQHTDHNLRAIIRYGTENHRIVFSPFEADVERGVLGGLVVRERILPYINVKAMTAAGVQLKPFFLRIAKRYE